MVDATCVAYVAVTPHRLYRLCGKLELSMTSVSGVFVVGKSHPSRTFLLLEDSECFLNLSLLVILRSCIASLKVLNYNLEDHLKKVYDCVRFIQTIPMVETMRGPALRTVIGRCQ